MSWDGVLLVAKPAGITSHDVVRILRRLLGQRRIGHTGTLDPFAEGLLLACLGRACRLAQFAEVMDKEYRGEILLGRATDTDDVTGTVIEEQPIPPLLVDDVEALLARFRGPQEQVPPVYSAIKVGGRRSHRLARDGMPPDLPPRPIIVHELRLLAWNPPRLRVEVLCSKGAYVRALARDLGRAAGTVGCLASLRRTRVGRFRLAEAESVDAITVESARWGLLPPEALVEHLPAVSLSADLRSFVARGMTLEPEQHLTLLPPPETPFRVMLAPPGGVAPYFAAIGMTHPETPDRLRLSKVFCSER